MKDPTYFLLFLWSNLPFDDLISSKLFSTVGVVKTLDPFILAEVITVSVTIFRQVKQFCSVHMGKCDPAYWVKVCRGDVDFVKCKQKVFPPSGKVVLVWDKNYLGHRDLAFQQARSP